MTIDLALLSRVAWQGREVTAPRLRTLLAVLAADLRAGASTARLVDGLWPDEQPEHPAKALQVLVARARTVLGPDVLVNTPSGYRLALAPERVDASAVVLHATAADRHADAGDHAAALAAAEAGLALWDAAPDRHPAGHDPLDALRATGASTYRVLTRARALALARLGRTAEAAPMLAALAAELPRDEELLLEVLRTEPVPAALARYDAYRRALRDRLGINPGPALTRWHQQTLRGTVRRGIPLDPNPLVGRDVDRAAVRDLLRTSRVTSIVGPGGLGKTRLAQAVARDAEQPIVHLVALAGVADDADVLAEVASAVGRPGDTGDPVSRIVAALAPGPALLVLDNCEHVVAGAAALVGALVSRTAGLRVLTTTRTPLGLSSESVYSLPPLDLPTTVELFTQRARAARPGVDLPPEAVAALCRRLDGLPLAVELAAARVRALSVREIERRLDDRFALLRGGARDAPARHRTLHAVVDWSWNLLDEAGREALRTLSIFPGGFTADAAAHVLADGDALESLVEQSLLQVTEDRWGVRFRMLEAVRAFGAEQRNAEAAITVLLDWARAFGVTYAESLSAPQPFAAADRIGVELDNLTVALRHALAREDGATVAAVTAVLGVAWTIRFDYARLAALVGDTEALLSHYRPEPALVEALRTAAALSAAYSFLVGGRVVTRSLAVLRRLPPAPPTTLPRAVATLAAGVGSAVPNALDALSARDEPLLAGVANTVAGYLAERANQPDAALRAAERSLAAVERSPAARDGNALLRISAHTRIGELCLGLGDGARARHHLLAAVHLLESLGGSPDFAQARWGMALANLQVGDLEEAERWLGPAPEGGYLPEASVRTFHLAVRAEIQLAKGEAEAGLATWRNAVATLDAAEPGEFPVHGPWGLELRAALVAAHAAHDRLALVADTLDGLPEPLAALLDRPAPSSTMDAPVIGALLLALGTALLAGEPGPDARARAARLVALAERFRHVRSFVPTMRPECVALVTARVDDPAYREAVSRYAGLDPASLREAARAELDAYRANRARAPK
ncbi:ATP-binding protein [Cryptosporangium aurantiacum]|uniref:Predicted ATPase n=1 Tax=Cryptosporangium aurantiacum TaxID=134849 RepID=A0A1M7RM00_9ACTN|nr:BTAD domain-containing putative transcriptional regulator [Cryptosporangium aurantiacum]SHN47146.1 Predicted ATPase [Cryptosporangium aurantiacum]